MYRRGSSCIGGAYTGVRGFTPFKVTSLRIVFRFQSPAIFDERTATLARRPGMFGERTERLILSRESLESETNGEPTSFVPPALAHIPTARFGLASPAAGLSDEKA